MGKKILISTFNNSLNNYGAVFQSFALSKTIERLGHDAHFLTLQHRIIRNYVPPKMTFKRKLKEKIAKHLSKATVELRTERAKKFRSFIQKTQKQEFYGTLDDVIANPPIADIYISGSDQVWNPKSLRDELFLSFAPDDAVIVSYAASMGNEIIPDSNKDLFAKYISRYDAISVREDTIPTIIKDYTDKPILQHVDPVFLLEQDEWMKLSKPYNNLKFKKYIMLYMIEFDRSYIKKFKQLRKDTGLPIVLVTIGGLKRNFADQVIMDASPEEFLYLLSCAEMVVASSFHGCALSIIFNKPFISISGKDKPTRIESMLRHFKLEKQNNADLILENAKINFEDINHQIESDRKDAETYLKNVFSMEK